MKLSETINYINQALNYPALSFSDVSLYFDSAIAELNTTLHTKIPTVTEMIANYNSLENSKEIPTILITDDPKVDDGYIIPVSTTELQKVYYNPSDNKFHYLGTSSYQLRGVFLRNLTTKEYYAATALSNYQAVWQMDESKYVTECDLSYYFTDEWVLLWLIPYICFKYTVRDGGTATTFAEELTQGFQQLQETYNVPEKILLASVADKPAYKEIVEENLTNLNIVVRTRAIYESMKHNRALNGIFGSFYDRGGF